MKLSDFDYTLPKELIAQYPLKERDAARLLVLDRKKGAIEHTCFKDITNYFNPGDLLVLNDTKVVPSRIIGRRITGGRVELLLLKQKSGLTFDALIRPGRIRLKEKIIFNGGKISAEVTSKNEVTFSAKDREAIYNLGVMPLPPYIKRDCEDSDNIYYQTIYARENGSIASPTAGLHFTGSLLKEIESSRVNIGYLTLHVGISTFKPVKAPDVTTHKMEEEEFIIPAETIKLWRDAKKRGNRVFCAGTTTVRALEASAGLITDYQLPITNYRDSTELFIYPGYKFKMADCLITNFHLPKTTLFMLTCAFAGEELTKKAYQEAVDKKYRFYSYGDAMLII